MTPRNGKATFRAWRETNEEPDLQISFEHEALRWTVEP